jgi:hypothetical protein
MTAVGRVRLSRAYFAGPGQGFPADSALGVDGLLSPGALRMASLAGAGRPFAKAQALLWELAGLRIDDDLVRRTTHAVARAARAARPSRADAARLAAAPGAAEVAIDAGKVNTTGGWRDVKVAVAGKREAGPPAAPAEWDTRELPAPSARSVVAEVEEAGAFAARLRAEADRLGLTAAEDVTVLGDGAAWVWGVADEVFPQAAGVLDIYHAAEHVSDAAKAVWGEGAAEAATALEAGRAALLSTGKAGLERWIGEAFASGPCEAGAEALVGLAAYFAAHPARLGYAGRLAEGRSIGSGMVEGAIKQMVNLRMKRSGARWRAENVGPLVELIALTDSPDWAAHWESA